MNCDTDQQRCDCYCHTQGYGGDIRNHQCDSPNSLRNQLSAAQEEIKVLKYDLANAAPEQLNVNLWIEKCANLEHLHQKLREALESISSQSPLHGVVEKEYACGCFDLLQHLAKESLAADTEKETK